MNHIVAAILLVLVTVGWFLLALLPALREHFARRDVQPLRLSSEAADIRFFAQSFRRYVERHLQTLRGAAAGAGGRDTLAAIGSDAVWYAAPGDAAATLFAGTDPGTRTDHLVVITERSLRVPDDAAVLRELYTAGSLDGGENAVFRAALVEGDASLGARTQIIRWVDAGGSLRVGRDASLWGRASSSGTMFLDDGAQFERLAGPRIVFGSLSDVPPPPPSPSSPSAAALTPVEPPNGATVSEGRWSLEGDLDVPDAGVVQFDLVLTGRLTLGRGARIDGAVHAQTIVAAEDCTFGRSIVAERQLVVGERTSITGPVAVEGEAEFGAESRIGGDGDETTITAISVRMSRGVVACGEVWARSGGVVGEREPAPPQRGRATPAALKRPSLRG